MTPSRKSRTHKQRRLRARLFVEGRDIWVGVFWKVTSAHASDLSDGWEWRTLHVYICLLPCLPLLITYSWRRPWADDAFTQKGQRRLDPPAHRGATLRLP